MAKLGQVQHFNKPLEDALGFSAILHANGLLHLAGIVSVDDVGAVHAPNDMAAQIDRIYDIMEATLAKCGATLEHVMNSAPRGRTRPGVRPLLFSRLPPCARSATPATPTPRPPPCRSSHSRSPA
jgi:hypothetical protein